MQPENFFTYKLYTATDVEIDVDKVLGRRLIEKEESLVWTPEQRAEIFNHIGNADQVSAFRMLFEIVPLSLSIPYSELTTLQRNMNRALEGEGTQRPGDDFETSIDHSNRELVNFVVRWLVFRRVATSFLPSAAHMVWPTSG